MFSSTIRYYLIAILALTLALSACGNDETGGNNANNGSTDDASIMDVSDAGDEDASGEQDADDDSSDPGDTDDTSTDSSDDDSGTQDAGDDTSADDATSGDTSDTTDTADTADEDADTRGACGVGTDQTCAFPASSSTCDQGDWGAGSFIDSFDIQADDDCCYDYDGDGDEDSGIERLDTILELAGFTFNELIRIQIESGGLSYLVTYEDWSNPVNDPQSEMNIVFGDSSSTWIEKQNGNGIFTVTSASVDTNGDPLSNLQPMDVCSSHITVRGGSAPLKVPIGSNLVTLNLNDVRIDADATAPLDLSTAGKVGLNNGELGGWVTVEEVFGALNTISQTCPCLQKDVFELQNGAWTCTATTTDQTNCTGAAQVCDEFVSEPALCGLAAQRIEALADYDALPAGNPDGTNDAYTIGARFTATGAELTGTQR